MTKDRDFAYYRKTHALNTFCQVVLLVAALGGALHLATSNFARTDLTDTRRHSLSAETLSYLANLEEPVKIIVTITPESDNDEIAQFYHDVRGLLREYEYAARNTSGAEIDVEFVNVHQQRKRAELIAQQYGVQRNDLIIFASGDRQRIIFPNELYRSRDRQRQAFQGEQVFTSALLDISGERRNTIYFITGHGEMRFDDADPNRGISQLGYTLQQRNFDLRYLDLTEVDRVPEDADLVMLISPRAPLLSREEELLRRYLSDRAGRLIAMIDPGTRHGLGELFYEWGILMDDVVVLDTGPDALAQGGDLILKRYGEHPITQALVDNHLPLIVGLSRSVRPDPGRPLDDSLSVRHLIASSDTSWGERSYRQGRNFTYDPDVDLQGPLGIALVSERQMPSQIGINMPGGRVVAFGTSDLVANHRISSLGNLTLFLNTINWMLDRDSMINIPPRPVDEINLVLTAENIKQLRWTLIGLMPGIVALFGIAVYWIRRK